MYIRKRLRVSYAAMLIIPVIIIFVSNIFFFTYEDNSIENSSKTKVLINKVNFFNEILQSNSSFSRKINNQVLKDPDAFLKEAYVKKLEKSIDGQYSSIVIRKGNKIIYSSENIKSKLNKIALPAFGSNIPKQEDIYNHRIKTMILSQQDFYFKDGNEGSIFYVLNPSKINAYVRKYSYLIIFYVLIIIALTNGILTYLVSKSIIKPLNELGHAANEIKSGNLNYEIKEHSKDEIGEVCDSFEEMRLQLKESLEVQQHYEENRKELISNISHDLKTPITSIKGYIEGIRDGVADTPEKMNRYIETIYTKANYMDNLIEDLFLFSKLDLNRLPFDFQKVDIGVFINDFIDEISFDLDKNSIDLKADIAKEPMMVRIDIQKIKRVMMNLVENCIKYRAGDKLLIKIGTENRENQIVVKVSDNGKGISGEALPHIFDRFYRAENFRETSTGGSGLGLAIVKRIIEEHEGKIWAESELNKGTTVFFTLSKEAKEVSENE